MAHVDDESKLQRYLWVWEMLPRRGKRGGTALISLDRSMFCCFGYDEAARLIEKNLRARDLDEPNTSDVTRRAARPRV
jgi:hypothetical protein